MCELGKGTAKIIRTNNIHNANKERINFLRAALYDIGPAKLQRQLNEIFATDCVIHPASPFEDLDGPAELLERAYLPLIGAISDLERRDFIVMAGHSPGQWNGDWVGCGGHYMGVFEGHWLDIPPTKHLVSIHVYRQRALRRLAPQTRRLAGDAIAALPTGDKTVIFPARRKKNQT